MLQQLMSSESSLPPHKAFWVDVQMNSPSHTHSLSPLPFQLDNEENVELHILLISLEHLK